MTMKEDELFGLSKIPDSVIIKEQAIEIGKLKAYIEELEAKLPRPGLTSEEKIEIKRGEYYENHRQQKRKILELLRKCRKEKQDLIQEIVKLKSTS